MSWGERSCKECKAPEDYCEMDTCNVDCPYYEWDGTTKPDSINSVRKSQEPFGMNRHERRAWERKQRRKK